MQMFKASTAINGIINGCFKSLPNANKYEYANRFEVPFVIEPTLFPYNSTNEVSAKIYRAIFQRVWSQQAQNRDATLYMWDFEKFDNEEFKKELIDSRV